VKVEVENAVLEWTDVAGPGLPSFVFVDSHGDADIPIVWARVPDGDWYIAFCSYDVNTRQQRFGVEQILVTGRYGDGQVANLDEIHETVLHEIGHALGLMGHSDDPDDIMFPAVTDRSEMGLSDRDRRTLAALYEHGSRQIRGRRGRRY
jgi:predicted Zn-dependent protease